MLECLMAARLWQLLNYFFKGFGFAPVSLKIFGGDSSHFELYFSLQAINADIFDSEPIENLLHIFWTAKVRCSTSAAVLSLSPTIQRRRSSTVKVIASPATFWLIGLPSTLRSAR